MTCVLRRKFATREVKYAVCVNLVAQNVDANSHDANSNLGNIQAFVEEIKSNLYEIKTNPLFIKSKTRLVNKIAIAVELGSITVTRCITHC